MCAVLIVIRVVAMCCVADVFVLCVVGHRPSADLLRSLLCRECKRNDMFTVSLLKYWAQEYADKLAELLHSQLTRSSGTPKRKGHRCVPV